MDREHLHYMEQLSEMYPTINKAAAEIINLQAIVNLPKGTEHFLSDIHGEYDAFSHVLKNGSGAVRKKIEDVFGLALSDKDKAGLATLIYYPKKKMELIKQTESDMDLWYKVTLYRLIEVCKTVSSKYTRSKVRKALPEDYAYVIEELITEKPEVLNKEAYYEAIVNTVVELGQAEQFIVVLCELIQQLAVDHLHVLGDIFDRGAGSHLIMDKLCKYHSLDIQWGNHDIIWMGAAAGNLACVATVIRNSIRYGNIDLLEEGYGINLRPLAIFANHTYKEYKRFKPKNSDGYNGDDEVIVAKIHKAISIIMYKLECQTIAGNPDFEMSDRRMLEKIDYESGRIEIDGVKYPLKDRELPTVDPKNPAKLTDGEIDVLQKLCLGFKQSEKLQKHIRFLYSHGSVYKEENNILMFHGGIPLNEDGSMRVVALAGKPLKGKALLDHVDELCRVAYFGSDGGIMKRKGQDVLWYLWCGKNSPLFGRSKMATFESVMIGEKSLLKEKEDSYYKHQDEEKTADMILKEFGLDPAKGRIINGHVPVKVSSGENPIKANGKIIVIDGGFSRAYHKKTGIAGYTMVYSSRGISLRAHQPFTSLQDVVFRNSDIKSKVDVFRAMKNRVLVESTDEGREIQDKISDLKKLISAYGCGIVKQAEN